MKALFLVVLSAFCFFFVASGSAAAQCTIKPTGYASPPDLSGCYRVQGKQGDRDYTGEIRIEKRGKTYLLDWRLPKLGNYKGIGIQSGNVLAASWGHGVILYFSDRRGKKLCGQWAVSGKSTIYFEKLTRLKDDQEAT